MSDENICCLQEINIKDDKIKKLTKNQLKQETELKDKIIRIEQELLKKDHVIKNLKKEVHEISQHRFFNPQEGYELFVRGCHLDLDRYHKKINVEAQALVNFICQDAHSQLKVTQVKPRNMKSKEVSTEGSNKSFKEVKE